MKKRQEAVEFVKRRLWSHGYGVKRVPAEAMTFDLLVDGVTRVCVIASTSSSKGPWMVGADCDVVAIFFRDRIGGRVLFSRTADFADAALGRVEDLVWEDVQNFTASPRDVFISSSGKEQNGKKSAGGGE